MEFRERIKQIREEYGLSQRQMAEKLYLTRTVISKWENGTRYPNYQEMDALKKLFNVSVDSLFSDDDVKKMPEVEPILQQNPEITIQGMFLTGIFIFNIICCMFQLGNYFNYLSENGAISIGMLIKTVIELASILVLGYCIYKSFNNEITKKTVLVVLIINYGCYLVNTVTDTITASVISWFDLLDCVLSLLIMVCMAVYFLNTAYCKSKYVLLACGIQTQLYLFELYRNFSQTITGYMFDSAVIYYISDFGRKVLLMCFIVPQIITITRKRVMRNNNQ
ncbi:MAG: helix-turn-helix transcriptional regulator [Erysipelotrichaceae bacterium]|nr:helix-turn-helix transcriptional regulator [Erysipelotrichaceae bacterium]